VDKPRKFGEFLESLAHPESASAPEIEDESKWAETFQKAADRYFLPKRLKRLEQKLKNQRANSASAGSSELVRLIAAVKKLNPNWRGKGAPKKIAALVDHHLKSKQQQLANVCPKGWLSISDLPRSFSEALTHKKVKR